MSDKTKIEYISRLVQEELAESGDSLEFKNKFIGDEGLETLCEVDGLEKVENLDLTRNHITHRSIPFLARCTRFTGLKRLYIGENNLGDRGAIALSQALFLPQLVHFDARFNHIGQEGGRALAMAAFKKIQVFILQDNQTGDECLDALARNPGFMHTRKLNLYRTELSDKSVKTLARSKVLKKLKHLNLARNILRLDSALALAKTKTLTNIETLLMFDTFIGDQGVEALTRSESLPKLKTLRMT